MELEKLPRASSGLRLAQVGGIANWRGPQVGAAPGGGTPRRDQSRSVYNSSMYTFKNTEKTPQQHPLQPQDMQQDVEMMVVGHVEPNTERSTKRRVRVLQSSAPPTHQLTVERKKQNAPQKGAGTSATEQQFVNTPSMLPRRRHDIEETPAPRSCHLRGPSGVL